VGVLREQVSIRVEGKAAHRDAVVYSLVEPAWGGGEPPAEADGEGSKKRKSTG
jgi:hypothetical protein